VNKFFHQCRSSSQREWWGWDGGWCWFCSCDNYGATHPKDRPENTSQFFRF